MDKEHIIATLREHEDELQAAGIEHLFLHGSYVRGTVGDASDVDVIAEFDRGRQLSLIGRVHLENRLTDILGVKADLADRQMLRPEVLKEPSASLSLSFSPLPQRWFRDIADAIGMVEEFTAGMDFEAFRSSPMAVAAVERKLQIISEAAIRLGDQAERQCPGQPWRDIRGIGNQLRHAYERVDLRTVWSTITGDLPPLKAAVLRALMPPPASGSWLRRTLSCSAVSRVGNLPAP